MLDDAFNSREACCMEEDKYEESLDIKESVSTGLGRIRGVEAPFSDPQAQPSSLGLLKHRPRCGSPKPKLGLVARRCKEVEYVGIPESFFGFFFFGIMSLSWLSFTIRHSIHNRCCRHWKGVS